jgi:hypothetical protein
MLWTQVAGLAKITWTDKEQYAPIIGDAGVDFIKQDIDLAMDDYATFVRVLPPSMQNQMELKEFVKISLQQQKLELDDALDLMFERDVDVAKGRLKRALRKKKEADMQMQQQMAMQQQQQAAQLKMQGEQTQAQLQSQLAMTEEQAKQDRMKDIEMQRHKNRMQEDSLKSALERQKEQ